MACVETIPVPDSRKKVDELFLFWLSEPSTQEILRKELSKVCGMREMEEEETPVVQPAPSSVTNVLRPVSPNLRTPSPPPLLSRSPKSPRSRRRSKSPRKPQGSTTIKAANENIDLLEEVDTGVEPRARVQLDKSVENDAQASSTNVLTLQVPSLSGKGLQKRPELHPAAIASRGVAPPLSESIPKFYFPNGKPNSKENIEQTLKDVANVFQEYPKGEVTQSEFHVVVKVCARNGLLLLAHNHLCNLLITYLQILSCKDAGLFTCIGKANCKLLLICNIRRV